MFSSSLDENVILYCICPFLNYKDRYNLSVTNKFFSQLGKLYKKTFKENNNDVYNFIVSKVKENIEYELQMFLNLFFNISISMNDRIYIYNKELPDGIYYFSKCIFVRQYITPLFLYPTINIRSHNLYLVIFVKNKIIKTKVFKDYYSSFIEEDEYLDFYSFEFNQKIIRLV